MFLNIHVVSASLSQAQTVPVTSPAPRVSSSPRASPTNTPTTWSAPSSSSSPPAWTWPSPSSPLTWRTTPCQAERGTASTTGWKCGTGSREVRRRPTECDLRSRRPCADDNEGVAMISMKVLHNNSANSLSQSTFLNGAHSALPTSLLTEVE